MKNNRGFTLVELIAIIVILSVLIVLVVPTLSDNSQSSKNRIYKTKLEMIKSATIIYAEDNYSKIVRNTNNICQRYNKNNNIINCTIQVTSLIPTHLQRDNENLDKCALDDPREAGKCLDDLKIEIEINKDTKKIIAKYKNND